MTNTGTTTEPAKKRSKYTKAAVATGTAAFLLLGGAGTLAYWADSGSATDGHGLESGHLTVTDGTFSEWRFSDALGGDVVTAIVPGDEVQAVATIYVTGHGDHLGVSASLSEETRASFIENNPLTAALLPHLTVGDVQLDGVPVPSGGLSLPSGGPHKLTVTVTATFPRPDVMDNTTQNLTATLDGVTIDVVQQHIPNA